MLRQRLSGRQFNGTPRSAHNPKYGEEEEQPILTERRWGLILLFFSLTIIASKLYVANHEYIKKTILEQKLVTYEIITEDGQVMFTHAWKTAVKYSSFWLPPVCGILTTYFTWMMVYLDSNMPGIQPPSPFSPNKYKSRSGHSFHLNYVIAVFIGILVTIYMYWKGATIQY